MVHMISVHLAWRLFFSIILCISDNCDEILYMFQTLSLKSTCNCFCTGG